MSQIYKERRRTAEKPADAPQVQSVQEPAVPMSSVADMSALGQRTSLPDAVRQKMENAFGADFSGVELYESEAVADAGAEAVTIGNRIAFAPDKADLSSAAGQELLGHELSHVVTQARGEVQGRGFLNDRALEARADREGAMAAAGESVYTGPVTPLSASSVASAAGPMQAKKEKEEIGGKDTSVSQTPGMLATKRRSGIKKYKVGINGKEISVGGVKTKAGGDAVIKMGTNPLLESVYADMFNAAGSVYANKRSEGWTFDAPAARGLTDEEKNGSIGKLIDKNVLGSRTVVTEEKKAEAQDNLTPKQKKKAEKEAKKKAEKERKIAERENATVFAMAGGLSADPNELEAGQATALQSISSEEEKRDYQRMMGYVTLMDCIAGNYDRVMRNARGNWKDDTPRQQVHLIDNDDMGVESLRHGNSNEDGISYRDAWVTTFYHRTTNGNATGDFKGTGSGIVRCLSQLAEGEPEYRDVFSAGNTDKGFNQGFEDLPLIREEMLNRFVKTNGGGKLNKYQEEVLERIQMAQEMMSSDADMNNAYHDIATGNNVADAWETIRRKRALAEGEYGGQTHGAKPTATSGDGWTRGTAADWLGPQPQQQEQKKKKRHFWNR